MVPKIDPPFNNMMKHLCPQSAAANATSVAGHPNCEVYIHTVYHLTSAASRMTMMLRFTLPETNIASENR